MEDKIALICSVLAVAISVTAPILTALINNIFKLKIEQQKFKQEKSIQVIENFLKNSSVCIDSYITESFRKSSSQVYIYTPKKHWKDLDEFIEMIDTHNDKAKIKYIEISKMYSDILNYRK